MIAPAEELKARLRADLVTALKDRRPSEAMLIRGLIAALDNAEAPVLLADSRGPDHHRFHDGSAETDRLHLSRAQVHAVLLVEIRKREVAAAEMERLERLDLAEALQAEIRLARRYVE